MQFLNLSDNEFRSSLTSIVVTFDVVKVLSFIMLQGKRTAYV